MAKGKKIADAIEAENVRLTVKVELADSYRFTSLDFSDLLSEATKTVLGSCGPIVESAEFAEDTLKGSVILSREDLQLVWAALSIYGKHRGRSLAVHFNALTEYKGSL